MGVTLVFMGDSITEGQYVDLQLGWTDLLATRLKTALAKSGIKIACHNRGISGETTRQGLERFPRDVQGLRPDVMTLQFGLNDCNCWDTDEGVPRVSEAAYRANLIEMIARARNFGTREIILSTNHTTLRHRKMAGGKTLEEQRKRYNELVREVAKETKVTLCDIDRAFGDLSQEALAELLLPEPDLLHLSPKGHTLYAETIYPLVLKAIQNASAPQEESKYA